MSETILTLFGEEIIPEQQKPVPKPRAKKQKDEQTDEVVPDEKKADVTLNEDEPETTKVKSDEANAFLLPEDWEGEKNTTQ